MIKLLWCGGSVLIPTHGLVLFSGASLAFETLDIAGAIGLAGDLKASWFKGSILLVSRITQASWSANRARSPPRMVRPPTSASVF
jgi:hypothetical protein